MSDLVLIVIGWYCTMRSEDVTTEHHLVWGGVGLLAFGGALIDLLPQAVRLLS